MAENGAPKSAYELAMERLRKRDQEAGIENRPVTDAQKAAIAEVRNFYEAKLAEAQVLHESNRRKAADLAALDALEQEYRRERERLTSERDRKVQKIRES
jgi:LPS O-antigen subunit length determinant protein (WzzB/FepE family)